MTAKHTYRDSHSERIYVTRPIGMTINGNNLATYSCSGWWMLFTVFGCCCSYYLSFYSSVVDCITSVTVNGSRQMSNKKLSWRREAARRFTFVSS